MATSEENAKQAAKTLLSLSILATYAVKYGIDFCADVSKEMLKNTDTMKDQFLAKVPKVEVGEELLGKTVSEIHQTLDIFIQIQKKLKNEIK